MLKKNLQMLLLQQLGSCRNSYSSSSCTVTKMIVCSSNCSSDWKQQQEDECGLVLSMIQMRNAKTWPSATRVLQSVVKRKCVNNLSTTITGKNLISSNTITEFERKRFGS